MSKRIVAIVVGVALVCGLALLVLVQREDAAPELPEVAAPAESEGPEGNGEPELDIALPEGPLLEKDESGLLLHARPSEELRESLRNNEFVREKLEEVKRQREADARFQAGAEGYEAAHVNRSVVALFETIELEPRLEEGGLMTGLEIRSLDARSPLLAAGFEEGDTIVSFNDEPLVDPGDLPGIVTRLERDIDVCAQRGDERICRRVVLE